MNRDDYPVFPDADAGTDPSVHAEQGGQGFKGQGWETNTNFDLIGDPHAVKGGLYREYITDFPGTLRMIGPEHNTYVNAAISQLVYEGLLNVDPTSLNFVPSLATHWQISADKMTYRFRINPTARWSDGQPVVADDVVATWALYTDKGAQDPALFAQFTGFEKPVAESKYVIRVKSKQLNWLNFWVFSTMPIFPAHVLKNYDGAAFIREFNFKYVPGTGPYIITDADIRKGQSISARRRRDYWAEKARWNAGQNNFDEIRFVVVRDPNLAFEMFKKGDLDFYYVSRSLYWVKEFDFDAVKRGLIQKRKVFNNMPEGYSGYAMNTRRPPFSDLRVRKALTLLQNRPLMIEKIFFNEYLPENSYFPNSPYENPADPKNDYNPQEALKLLADAGWKDRDAQGHLTKDGKPLTIEMLYDDKQLETYLTVYQEDLRKIGITLNLRLVTFETNFKLISERQFEMNVQAWSSDLFPNPEVEWHSRLADVNDNDNVTGFKDPRIDAICEKYRLAFDPKERVRLIRDLDLIMTEQYHYALSWYGPAQRIAYWNKFGTPPGLLTRIGRYMSISTLGPGPEQLWWIDPEKAQKLDQARRNSSMQLEVGQTENRYWQEYAKKEEQKAAN
jgi:microcin C transport system substrate-binding protein